MLTVNIGNAAVCDRYLEYVSSVFSIVCCTLMCRNGWTRYIYGECIDTADAAGRKQMRQSIIG